MDWRKLFFSIEGRLNRKPYWLAALALIAVVLAIGLGGALVAAAMSGEAARWSVLVAVAIAVLVTLWPGLAISVKRLHDRGKSAWWLLVFYLLPGILDGIQRLLPGEDIGAVFSLAAAAISIWALLELGFLKGTQGANRYGPDPLGGTADAEL